MSRVLNKYPHVVHPGHPQNLYATVSANQPAPGAFTDPLYVVEPHNPNAYKMITQWNAPNLPVAGDVVTIIIDNKGTTRAIVWNGNS